MSVERDVQKRGIFEVVDKLFISDYWSAKDTDLVEKYRISHILNCTMDKNTGADFLEGYLQLKFVDSVDLNIAMFFPDGHKFIDEVLEPSSSGEEGKYTGVLVHCNRGLSRSATMVVSYLMSRRKMTLSEAYDHLERKRCWSLGINQGFMRILYEMEEIKSVDYMDWLITSVHHSLSSPKGQSRFDQLNIDYVKKFIVSRVDEKNFQRGSASFDRKGFISKIVNVLRLLEQQLWENEGKFKSDL